MRKRKVNYEICRHRDTKVIYIRIIRRGETAPYRYVDGNGHVYTTCTKTEFDLTGVYNGQCLVRLAMFGNKKGK